MKQIIIAHNRKLLNMQKKKKRMCDCSKQEYPVNGKCLSENLTYKATVKTGNHTKFNVGSTGISFKDRYTKHTYSFRHEKHCNAFILSQYIWKLKISKSNYKTQGKV